MMLERKTISGRLFQKALDFHPVTAFFEVTKRCNLQCRYCYHIQEGVRGLPDCFTAEALRIIDAIDAAGVLNLTLSGGEPFARPDILTLLAHVQSKNFFTSSLLSNGTLIKPEHIAFLEKHRSHFPAIKFSAFSHLPSIHDAFTGMPGSLELLIKNGRSLMKAGIIVGIAFNVFEFNIDRFQETKSFFENQGFSFQYGTDKVITSGSPTVQELEHCTSPDFLYRVCCSVGAEGLKEQIDRYRITHAKGYSEMRPCAGILTMITIDHAGNILPCLGFRNCTIGNVLTDNRPINDILKSNDAFHRIRAVRKNDFEKCRECEHIGYCTPCIGTMHSTNGSYSDPPLQCCNAAHALKRFILEHESRPA